MNNGGGQFYPASLYSCNNNISHKCSIFSPATISTYILVWVLFTNFKLHKWAWFFILLMFWQTLSITIMCNVYACVLLCFFSFFDSYRGNLLGKFPYVSGDSCSECNEGQVCENNLCGKICSLVYSLVVVFVVDFCELDVWETKVWPNDHWLAFTLYLYLHGCVWESALYSGR